MNHLDYAVSTTPVPFAGFLAWCQDLPEVHAFGHDEAEALRRAAQEIERVLQAGDLRFSAGQPRLHCLAAGGQ